ERTANRPAPSLTGRGGRGHRPEPAGRRADATDADARAGRSSRAGVSRPVVDAGPVSRRRVGLRATDGAALLTAQHAGLSADRPDLAPERSAAGGAVAHRPYESRTSSGRDDPLRGRDPLSRR